MYLRPFLQIPLANCSISNSGSLNWDTARGQCDYYILLRFCLSQFLPFFTLLFCNIQGKMQLRRRTNQISKFQELKSKDFIVVKMSIVNHLGKYGPFQVCQHPLLQEATNYFVLVALPVQPRKTNGKEEGINEFAYIAESKHVNTKLINKLPLSVSNISTIGQICST